MFEKKDPYDPGLVVTNTRLPEDDEVYPNYQPPALGKQDSQSQNSQPQVNHKQIIKLKPVEANDFIENTEREDKKDEGDDPIIQSLSEEA